MERLVKSSQLESTHCLIIESLTDKIRHSRKISCQPSKSLQVEINLPLSLFPLQEALHPLFEHLLRNEE